MSKKYIATQVASENSDCSYYYDGDTFTEAAGDLKYCIFVPPSARKKDFNAKTYQRFQNQIEEIRNAFDDLANGEHHFYKNHKEAMIEIIGSYNPSMCSRLKKLMSTSIVNEDNPHFVVLFLNIVTPYHWEKVREVDYSQGDAVTVIYTNAGNSEEDARMFAKAWLGTLVEFTIAEKDEDDYCVGGYFVTDTMAWCIGKDGDNKLVKELAEQYGCRPEELEVQLIDKEKTVIQRTYKSVALTA